MIDVRFDRFVEPDPSGAGDITDKLVLAHRHCAAHRSEVLQSEICGCFSCCAIFPPSDISEWMDERSGTLGQSEDPWTAYCPNCGIDAVIGSASGYPVAQKEFLEAMNVRWFR